MQFLKYTLSVSVLLVFVQTTLVAGGGGYEIPWHTIDGGGAMLTSGGTFELSGSIGQPDAGSFSQPMMGGTFEVVGGFWTAPSNNTACACLGDMDGDGLKDGNDIQNFTLCMISGGSCLCADMDAVPGLSDGDVSVFVTDLLNDATCQ